MRAIVYAKLFLFVQSRDAVNRTRTTAPPARCTTTILHPGLLK